VLRSIRTAFVSSIVIFAAGAQHRYVDPTAGNNSFDGLTPATAWRTIGWANVQLPPNVGATIHVLPGTVSTASGELFPITLRGHRLIGDAGSAATVITAPPGSAAALSQYTAFGSGDYSSPEIRGFTIRNSSGNGISVFAAWIPLDTALRDIVIEDGAGGNMSALAVSQGGLNPSLYVSLDHVVVKRCYLGLSVSGAATGGAITIDANDCQFVDGFSSGAQLSSSPVGSSITLQRCRFGRNAQQGIQASPRAGTTISLSDCSIVRNGEHGLRINPPSSGAATVNLDRCTLASNVGSGLTAVDGTAPFEMSVQLRGNILFGNADDVDSNVVTVAARNDVGDGDFAGMNGNFSADPLFVAPLTGDFRLGFGSPCIDSGDPSLTAGGLDPTEAERVLDGDLDTTARVDLGSIEHRTLDLTSTGNLGSPLLLEITGAPGSATIVHFSRLGLAAPQSTPFGSLELPPNYGQLFVGVIPAVGPFVFQRPIPNNPALLGRTFGFQALMASAAAPVGSCWSSAEAVTIR